MCVNGTYNVIFCNITMLKNVDRQIKLWTRNGNLMFDKIKENKSHMNTKLYYVNCGVCNTHVSMRYCKY